MKNGLAALVIIVAMGAGLVAGIEASPDILHTSNSTITTTQILPTEATCSIPPGGNVVVSVVNSTNGLPIAFVPVHIKWQTGWCAPTQISKNFVIPTNSSGLIELYGTGGYYMNVSYDGNFSFFAMSPSINQTTLVRLEIPSGHVIYYYSIASSTEPNA